jgi:hypothetical protein
MGAVGSEVLRARNPKLIEKVESAAKNLVDSVCSRGSTAPDDAASKRADEPPADADEKVAEQPAPEATEEESA